MTDRIDGRIIAATLGKKIARVPAPAMERLIPYDWLGSIREPRNVLERSAILSPAPSRLRLASPTHGRVFRVLCAPSPCPSPLPGARSRV